MSSVGMLRPFVVAAYFMDPATGQAFHMAQAISAVSADHATGRVVSVYYTDLGGKLPLMATAVIEISRDTVEKATEMFAAIDAADKAEDEKVVGLRAVYQEALEQMVPPFQTLGDQLRCPRCDQNMHDGPCVVGPH